VSLQLTDEQHSMVATIREFAAKECGTREKRLALTAGGTTHHNAEIARKLGYKLIGHRLELYGVPIDTPEPEKPKQ
jgi:hypothetical protein